jgi:hypothetical protein
MMKPTRDKPAPGKFKASADALKSLAAGGAGNGAVWFSALIYAVGPLGVKRSHAGSWRCGGHSLSTSQAACDSEAISPAIQTPR